MQAFTVIGIGETGNGKSTFLNAYLQKNAFQYSDSPDSCTKITSVESNIINNKILKAIDTPGIKDTDNTDQENVKQLVEFLLQYKDGINVVAIVLNGQIDRFTNDTEKFIKIAHQMFNHPDFWEHLCIIFTKWYSSMSEEQKQMKQDIYKKAVIKSIREYTVSNINIDLPVFFVDSKNYQIDEKTKNELYRFNKFVFSKNAMKTTQAEIPNVFYEKVIREENNNYRYKDNLISEDGMKRTEYFANQSRYKLIDYYENESYTNWKNEKVWEIVKYKKIEYETKTCLVKIETKSITERRVKRKKVIGITIKKFHYDEVVGEKKIKTYEVMKREKITDFDENISFGNWMVIRTYTKENIINF